jgi:hypothetical protein
MPFKLPSKLPTKLPFTSHNAEAAHDKPKEPDLNDVLPTKILRIDLVLLIALCTDHMREALQAALPLRRTRTEPPSGKTDYTAALNRDDLFGNHSAATEAALLDAGTAYLNKWRTNVLRKTGEALSVGSDEVKRRKDAYLARTNLHETLLDTPSHDSPSMLPFKAVQTPSALLDALDDAKRALVLGAVLFILLSLETYPAHSRILLVYLCECLHLPQDVLGSAEATTAVTLLKTAETADVDVAGQTDEARLAQAEKSRQGRKWKVGLATVAGAVAIGITGGLAAPLLLGAAGAIMGGVGLGGLATLLGATIANPITIAALFGALGGRMTGKAMEEYAREVEDFRFMPTQPRETDMGKSHKLRVGIGISGWVQEENDVVQPWKVFSDAALEPFGLRYELAAMTNLANMLDTLLKDTAYSVAQAGALKLLLPVLSAAMLPVTLMKGSDKAGKVLAHALIAKVQGERPVTLVGFSLGGRVVSSCLAELAAQKAFGLVESAVIIGAPVPSDVATWRTIRAVVVGRVVNVYASKDFLLGFLYRARNAQLGVSGLQAISDVVGIENKDVTAFVTGHNQYRLAVGRILRELQFTDLDLGRVEDEEAELEAEQIREQVIHEEAKRNGLLKEDEDEDGGLKMGDAKDAETESSKGQSVSDTARDLEGLTFDDHEEAESAHTQKVEPAELPAREPVAKAADAGTRMSPKHVDVDVDVETDSHTSNPGRSSRAKTAPLTPTTSDDESDDDDKRPIQMMDMEPEAMPDTPVRPRGR